jgi:hypothetical protein
VFLINDKLRIAKINKTTIYIADINVSTVNGFSWSLGCWNSFGNPRWHKINPTGPRQKKRKILLNMLCFIWGLPTNRFQIINLFSQLWVNLQRYKCNLEVQSCSRFLSKILRLISSKKSAYQAWDSNCNRGLDSP